MYWLLGKHLKERDSVFAIRCKIKHILATLALTGALFILVKKALPSCGFSWDKPVSGHIQPIDTYREIQTVFNSCNEHSLVTFDVDNTLITANDVLARTAEVPLWFKIRLIAQHLSIIWDTETKEKIIDTFLGTVFQQAPRFIFDPDIVQFIKQIQQQKSTVVGLTTMGSGSTGTIRNLPEWRANMLKDFGINFSSIFKDVFFTSFPLDHNNYPCLYKGILCANYASKGSVLGAFLDYYHVKPGRIISFDDQQSALISIADECNKRGIAFSGYQILETKKLPGEWNTDRALLQFDYALQHAQWLNDKEADALLLAENVKPAC
jgi:hypothetical protein